MIIVLSVCSVKRYSILSTIPLIFILMTFADFSTFAFYVDVSIKNPWSISCVLFVPVHTVNLHFYCWYVIFFL